MSTEWQELTLDEHNPPHAVILRLEPKNLHFATLKSGFLAYARNDIYTHCSLILSTHTECYILTLSRDCGILKT